MDKNKGYSPYSEDDESWNVETDLQEDSERALGSELDESEILLDRLTQWENQNHELDEQNYSLWRKNGKMEKKLKTAKQKIKALKKACPRIARNADEGVSEKRPKPYRQPKDIVPPAINITYNSVMLKPAIFLDQSSLMQKSIKDWSSENNG